jgi:PHS family inorganic phosphate transporter-like MFS transporter
LSLTLVGSLGAAVLPWGSASTIYAVLSGCRFILGIGVGGMYPLSAAKVAESDAKVDATKIGWSFFFQAPGSMLPYVVGWILSAKAFDAVPTSLKFRVVLGLGCIPAGVVFLNELMTKPPAPSAAVEGAPKRKSKSMRQTIRDHPEYLTQLIGTGGTWFLYDISYYGTAIFQPQILQSIFETDTLSYWQNLTVSSMSLPGTIIAILLLKPKGSRWLNIYGFWLIAVSFGCLAICFHVSETGLKWPKFIIFCVCTFALSCGPNVGTYVLPATLYPFAVRTTFHGLSAGSGKMGAVIGTFIYTPIQNGAGIATVLWVQTAISIVAAILSIKYIGKETCETDSGSAASNGELADESTPLNPKGGANNAIQAPR